MREVLVGDIGNSVAKLGVWSAGKVRDVIAVPTRDLRASLAMGAQPLLLEEEGGIAVALACVVPEAEATWEEWAARTGRPLFWVRGTTPAPLISRYAEPERLGPDRLAAAAGAVQRLGAPVIVVSLGTATVVDAVSAEKEYLGGAIAAGVETALASLAEKTAALPRVEAEAPASPIGRDTDECLRIGAVLGTAGLVEGLVARMRRVVGGEARIALTGGNAGLVSPRLELEHEVFPALVLEGVGAIWETNRT